METGRCWQHLGCRGCSVEYSYHEKFGADCLDNPRSGATENDGREPGCFDGTTSLEMLLPRYECGPCSSTKLRRPHRSDCQHPEYSICGQRLDRVTIINVVDVPPKKDILFNLPTSIQATPLSSANGWVEAQMPVLLKAMADLQSVVEPDIS
jgi:hypothetical protein